ncbi:hypothetical protein H696_03526 [Fonticula alba]|uniref:Uncharacterized protein n=1 Tax=Fonticula alba TaxID=691883 RepID=A0A058Z835_FONAL|nr:hypothetical protein H696_03526 [Fonticula alba]KCV70063.1 hypothetical protein H696_03526 [Fonticula alba]|eukprot:XP_009495669.1 hypothetical protein H696_03526 [Fonticula alba]
MESLGPECTKARRAYEFCFNEWFNIELAKEPPAVQPALAPTPAHPCEELYMAYQQCIEVALHRIGLSDITKKAHQSAADAFPTPAAK